MRASCRFILLLPLAVLPWLFGGVHPWAQIFLAVAVLASLATWVLSDRNRNRPLPPAIFPLLLASCLGVFQLIPLSPAVLADISPRAAAAWNGWAPNISAPSRDAELQFRQSVGDFAVPERWTASIYPASSRHDLAFLVLAIAMFFLGAQLFSGAASQKLLWGVVAANGALFAFFGIAQQLAWSGRLYGQVALGTGGQPFAAFVNRNNASGYLNLCLAAAIGVALSCWSNHSVRPSRARPLLAARPWLHVSRRLLGAWQAGIRGIGRLDGAKLSSVMAIVVILAGILCAQSRGGWIALALAAGFVLTRLAQARQSRSLVWGSLLILVASFSLVQWLGQTESIGRRWQSLNLGTVSLNDARLAHWRDGLSAGSDYLFVGSGLGTYRYAYRPYVQSAERVWFFHAENQYLEAFVEGGIVGVGLLLATITLVAMACRRLLQERRGSASYLCGIVGTFALVSQSIHAFFDFGLYLPANMSLFALICGSVVGHAARLKPSSAVDGRVHTGVPSLATFSRPIFLPGLAAILFCASLFSLVEIRRACAAESAVRASHIQVVDADMSAIASAQHVRQLGNAIHSRPDDAEAHLALARQLVQRYRLQAYHVLRRDVSPEQADDQLWSLTSPIALHASVQRFQRMGRSIELENLRRSEAVRTDLKHASSHLLKAIRGCPLLPDAYLLLAEIAPVVSSTDIDVVLVERARGIAGGNFELLRECGLVELQAGRTASGLADLRRSAELEPGKIADILRLASEGIDAELLVNDALPASPFLMVQLAREHFSNHDSAHLYSALLDRAATLAAVEPMPETERLQLEATIFALQGRHQQAISRLSRAVEKRPDVAEWRYELASLLRQQDELDLAWEHATICGRMDPDNQRYDRLLRELVRARLASR